MIAKLSFLVVIASLFFASSVHASELNDGIQLYFDGHFQQAHERLSALMEKDKKDPRLHYFRGLASVRLGDLAAADRDFQEGARLELSTRDNAVGQALQRVQGRERLRLEKHRRMARLSTRRRTQPVAPRPITRDTEVKLTVGVATESTPTFRLASEVPLRRAQLPDLYADDPLGMLAQERQPAGPEVKVNVPAPKPGIADAPVGSGVAAAPTADEFAGFEDDPFALDTAGDVSASPAADPNNPPRQRIGKSNGVFGAVFRALRKATIPQFDTASVLPPGMAPSPPKSRPQDQFSPDSFPTEDPFAQPTDEAPVDAQDDPFSFDE